MGENLTAILPNTTELKTLRKGSESNVHVTEVKLQWTTELLIEENSKVRPNFLKHQCCFRSIIRTNRFNYKLAWTAPCREFCLVLKENLSANILQKLWNHALYYSWKEICQVWWYLNTSQWFWEFYIPINSVIDRSQLSKEKTKSRPCINID